MPLNLREVAISSLPLPMLLLDGWGKIIDANILAEEQFGTSVRKLYGRHLSDFFEPSSEVNAMLERVSLGETVTDDAFSNRFTHAPYSLHLGPYQGGAAVLMVPEGNRAEVEKQAKRQELAEAVARIALEMAHEVKNPLASLRGASQWLSEQGKDRDVTEISTHMLSDVDRIRARIDTFLQLGPRADIAMEPVNIHALLDDVCRVPAGVHLHRVYDPSLPPLMIHGARLRQAIENLWSNALEAGSTLIEWQTRMAPMVALPGHQGPVVELRITSNGTPIPDSLREHLFHPFVTGKERGSGLGLAIVQRVMQEHGGRVKLVSGQGRTSFVLHLPLRHPEQPLKDGEQA
ncbi:MAG: ATP-binding protein [Mariprofundaceae bacterium]|nr:ATP-binding protein [Mariprofundaceae bacterium]